MKRVVIPILFIISLFISELKAQNPFEKYGYHVKVLTMTNGKFNEFFDLDSIQQVGDVLINTNTMKVIGFAEKDSINPMPDAQLISRWISPDPLAEKYYHISPYAYVANNPLKYIDPNGMFFTGALEWLDNYKDRVNSDMKSNGERINKLENQIAELREEGKDRKADRLQGRVDNLVSTNAELQGILGEIDVLDKSDQEYRIENGDNLPHDAAGTTTFDFNDNAVVITMDKDYDIDAFAHELKHGYQFETGKIDLREGGTSGALFWDVTDEREANKRGRMFGTTFTPESGTPYELSIAPHNTDAQIRAAYKRLGITDKHAYRINGQTFIYP